MIATIGFCDREFECNPTKGFETPMDKSEYAAAQMKIDCMDRHISDIKNRGDELATECARQEIMSFAMLFDSIAIRILFAAICRRALANLKKYTPNERQLLSDKLDCMHEVHVEINDGDYTNLSQAFATVVACVDTGAHETLVECLESARGFLVAAQKAGR